MMGKRENDYSEKEHSDSLPQFYEILVYKEWVKIKKKAEQSIFLRFKYSESLYIIYLSKKNRRKKNLIKSFGMLNDSNLSHWKRLYSYVYYQQYIKQINN